jgi:phosphatidylglycerophosphatase A
MKTAIVNFFARLLASCCFVGYIPFASGTFGSAAAIAVLWVAVAKGGFSWQFEYLAYYWVAMLVAIFLASALATRARAAMGGSDPDPHPIVIDEFVGQIMTFFLVPLSVRSLVLGFFLFRFFDIVKPYPIHKMETLDDGLGIVMDDVAAGLCANVTLLCGIWLYQMVRALLNA